MIDVALAIEALTPGAQYGGSTTRNTKAAYDALRWTDARSKPSWTAIQAAGAKLIDPAIPAKAEIESINNFTKLQVYLKKKAGLNGV